MTDQNAQTPSTLALNTFDSNNGSQSSLWPKNAHDDGIVHENEGGTGSTSSEGPISKGNSGMSKDNNMNARNRVSDLVTTPAPTFKEKLQAYFYNKGMAPMPEYMARIYRNTPRYIYVNHELPEELRDPKTGHPLLMYPRNKIRTTKYTPLSFLPKNILFQFTNVANTYFLILVILGAFQIFGVPNPGLAAVPLIVIVCITAIKDAIEDYRRGTSDSELNNSPIHLLQGLNNTNVLTTYVGPWRKFKKSCTRQNNKVFKALKRAAIMVFGKKSNKADLVRQEKEEEINALRRVSTVHSEYSYASNRASMNRPSSSRPRKSGQSRVSRNVHSKPLSDSIVNPHLFGDNSTNTVFKNRRWKDVAIGDFIRIRANEEVPADVIIMSSSDIEGNCYIETKNLDGETNLKVKNSLKCGGSSNIKHSQDLGNTKFWIECDAPNSHLYTFRGTIHYENYDENGQLNNDDEKEAINNDNVLLRGSTLRNTKWVIGVVVYTGSETKVMLNSGITPTKSSLISRQLNLSVIINFLVLFVLCFVSGLINGLFYNKKNISRLYFDFKPYAPTAAANGVLAFFVTLIIYQSLVPISLYISVEIIKTLQAFFIYSDIKMYYDRLDFPCIPKSWNISDDLGQIEYIFSDKTGTLTQNVMEFKKCTINGKSYGYAYTEAKQGLDKREGVDIVKEQEKWKHIIAENKADMIDNLIKFSNNDQLNEEALTFISNDYVRDTITPELVSGKEQKEANEKFMYALALCHTVVTEQNSDNPNLRDFKAESPDEAALVAVARDVGIEFKERLRKSLVLNIYGKPREYELLQVIPFTSARKRMSCILRTPDNRILLISKGADNVIFSRLDNNLSNEEVITRTALHLEDFAKEGLRTLCIAQKELDPTYFQNWLARYKEAYSSIDDSREEIIDELDEEIEQNLILLGGTAIEDRLQQGVPDSIGILREAGIKLWVLTGDRIETAINIGFSCNLLGNDMKLLVVRPDEKDPENIAYIDNLVTKYLQENFNMLNGTTDFNNEIRSLMSEAKNDHSSPTANFALIIDGAALAHIFGDLSNENESIQNLKNKFMLLGKQCKSVICCRVSPSQKASVVKMVKTSLNVMTLAIGDGANDVAMIQAANIGIGIAGEEGRQAVMSSDYAIGQFKYLTRLLLVHGRWSYKRLAEMIPCFFYKNVVFTLTCFWYGIYNDFDGSYLYEYTYLMFYNLAFTSLPIIVLAVLDQDVSDTVSLLVPQLYRSGILGLDWSQYKFSWYMFDGLYQSVISFYFPYLLMYKSFQNPQGLGLDHRFWIGVVAACISVTSCNVYVLLQQYRWDWLTLLIVSISILLVYFWTGVWSSRVYAAEFYKAGAQILGTLACWCTIFIGVMFCLLPRFTFDFLMRNFRPRDIDIIREKALAGEYDDYPEVYDPTDLEDVEKHRILSDLKHGDPSVLERIGNNIKEEKNEDPFDTGSTVEKSNTLKRTFKTIKRRATVSKSRKNTIASNNINKLDLNQLRLQMMKEGQYTTARNSLDRIQTTHELPGLTQAETLLSYHTRTSINFDR